jgi:class 3 adenylate cyclase
MAKKTRKKDPAQPADPSALEDALSKLTAEHDKIVEAAAEEAADYAKLVEQATAHLPDYTKLIDAATSKAKLLEQASASLPDYTKLIDASRWELPDYAKLIEQSSVNFPDYAKLIDSATLKLQDYAKLIEQSSVNLPDYAKLIDSATLKLPDYAKLIEQSSVNLPDYATLIDSASWKLPDYAKVIEQSSLKASDYATLIDSASWRHPDFSRLTGTANWPGDLTGLDRLNLSRDITPHIAILTENSLSASADHTARLREEIDALRKNAAEQVKALSLAKSGSDQQKREIEQLQKTVDDLNEKQRLGFLLERVHPDAHEHLRHSHEFQDRFLTTGECSAFVLAVDIRRSTELMLKARTAEQFAEFMRRLCLELSAIVVNSLGVFDKFTGDGILAFFPDFYSGPDAAFRVLAAADQSHAVFDRLYREARTSFKSVLTEVGLGIGIDYGSVRLVQVAGGLTVVGEPVVYACRLSSGPPYVTLANQPAFEQIIAKFGGLCFSQERRHEFKHEGAMLAYEVRLNGREHRPAPPDWLSKNAPAESEEKERHDK